MLLSMGFEEKLVCTFLEYNCGLALKKCESSTSLDDSGETYQIDDTGWRRLIFCTLCVEEKTFASFLSPCSIGMRRFEFFAANVAGQ
jgi:hypothetical protein